MAGQAGTLETIAALIGQALTRLADGTNPRNAEQLGIRIPSVLINDLQMINSVSGVSSAAGALSPVLVDFADAIAAEDTGAIVAAGIQLITKVINTIESVDRLATTLNSRSAALGGLSAAEKAELQAFATELPQLALEFILVDQLKTNVSDFFYVLALLGVIELNPTSPGDALSTPTAVPRLYMKRVLDLLEDPQAYFEARYGWGLPSFNPDKLFGIIERMIQDFELMVETYTVGGKRTLEAFIFFLQENPALSPPGLDFELRVPAQEDIDVTLFEEPPFTLKLKVGGRFDAGGSGSIQPPFSITFNPPNATAGLELLMSLIIANPSGPMVLIGQSDGNRMTAEKFSASLGLSASFNSTTGEMKAEPVVDASVEKGLVFIDLSEGDGFIQQILSGVRVESNFDLKGRWKPSTGLEFEGSGGIEIALPIHIDLSVLELQTLYLIMGLGGSVPLTLELSTALMAKLGPLSASVDRIGAQIELSLPDDYKGNVGPVDLGFKFKPPNGIGLAIDAGPVKGGGYLYLDFDKGEYAGVLELDLAGIVAVKAIGLISTRMPDGSSGFSLLIIITAEFGTGIQLGFGFTLLGVGGLLGLNRTMRLEPIAQGIRTGAINSIMFPQNVVANAPRIISDLKTYFPVQKDIFLIGPMVKIGWGTPTLVSLSMGVIIEIPGNIAILGVLKVVLPDEEAPLLVLQVGFIGALEFDKKRAWFYAAMFDSRVLFMTIEGGMGVLVAWGDDANFVVSVGGFHPQFNPPPLPFPTPNRISIDILNQPGALIRVSGYFAVTSNTVQVGAKAELRYGLSDFGISGHIAFDALFQFSPFYFIISLSASLSVKVFGIGLFSVRISMSLEGPTPWKAKGTGSISLLFFDIDVDFSITWGQKEDTTLPPIAVMPLLKGELNKVENWTAQIPAANTLLVSLRQLEAGNDELVLHPVGQLRISQRAIPLDFKLDKVGAQKPSDATTFSISVEAVDGFQKISDAKEAFATGQYKDFKDAQKLALPAYDDIESGVLVSAAGKQTVSSRLAKRNIRYETIIIDTRYPRVVLLFFKFSMTLFKHFLGGSAIMKSSLSLKQKKQLQPFDEKIIAARPQYTVAFNEDNTPFAAEGVSFSSEVMAHEHMQNLINTQPNLAQSLHVIPQYEVKESA